MINNSILKLIVFLLSIVTIVTSCRKESMEFIQETEDTLESTSVVANLIQRTAKQDGSIDNIIDRANCLRIEFPVTVSANTIEVIVNSVDDLYTIEAIFDDEDEDTNLLEITFPITVKSADFTETIINSSTELLTLANNCNGENQIDDDIECLDFEYPITASAFNTNNELIETITINSDAVLYNFIESINEEDVIALTFPITITLTDGAQLTVFSLTELESTITTYANTCDEDDDYDFEDDDCNNCTSQNLINVLVECEDWIVKDLERNTINYDDVYTNYTFNFFNDNTVVSEWNSSSAAGTWTATGVGNDITVIINIPALALCNNNWMLHEIQEYDGETKVDLRLNGVDKLRYENDCMNSGGGALENILADGLWIVGSYTEDADDQTANYAGYQLNFDISGTVIADNGTNPNNGTWSVLNSDSQMTLNFGAALPFSEFNDDDWNVLSITNTQVIIQDISGGGGGTDTLTLQKL